MNTICSQYTATVCAAPQPRHAISAWIGMARAWWTRGSTQRQAQQAENELTLLDGLTAETLKDIGAPEWMQDRALRAQERARQGGLFERDSLNWR